MTCHFSSFSEVRQGRTGAGQGRGRGRGRGGQGRGQGRAGQGRFFGPSPKDGPGGPEVLAFCLLEAPRPVDGVPFLGGPRPGSPLGVRE